MKKFKRKIFGTKITLFVSKSRYRDEFKYKSFRSEFRRDNVKETLSYHLYPERYVNNDLGDLLRSSNSRAILLAHGGDLNGKWVYQDERFFGKKYLPIQDWINKNDGKYDDLFILACGGDCDIESEKSIVVHAKEDFSVEELTRHKVKLHVYIPGKGYL